MKKATWILVILISLLFLSVIASSYMIRNQFNKIDQSDPFWNYTKLSTGIFHHIVLSNSNETQVSFLPGRTGSVGILNFWESELRQRVHASIARDTLFVRMDDRAEPPGRRDWMSSRTLISISAPEIYSVQARNANLNMFKMKQKNFEVTLSGKSRMEFETYTPNFDSLSITQSDSTELKFEMADEIGSSMTLHAKSIYSSIHGYSILDIGHFQIDSYHPLIGPGAAVTLSGGTLAGILGIAGNFPREKAAK
jgi:hypothetical protein